MNNSLLENLISGLSPREALGYSNQREWSSLIKSLVDIRKQHKLSQAKVGELLGVSQSAVSQFEDGNSNPTLQTIKLYAMAVGAQVSIEVTPVASGASNLHAEVTKAQSLPRSSKPGPKGRKAELALHSTI